MAKDPAFLLYSKDWLEGTAEMTASERGIYINFLAHQHQKGDLPADLDRLQKLAGAPKDEFLEAWKHLQGKFKPVNGNRLVNRKLTEVVTERSTKSLTNRITGTLASVIRLNNEATPEQKEQIKKMFNVGDFLTVSTDSLTVSLTEWFTGRLKSIGNANANANGNTNTNTDANRIGGAGGKDEVGSDEPIRITPIIPQMCAIWYETIPNYTRHQGIDYKAMGEILRFICDQHNVTNFLETES
jgi:uncharacterized protein YdaU (DUF1376 family)